MTKHLKALVMFLVVGATWTHTALSEGAKPQLLSIRLIPDQTEL